MGDAPGITFQQIQKYQRGANRVSASKLYEIARMLGAPMTFFFEGLADLVDPDRRYQAEERTDQAMKAFLATDEGLASLVAGTSLESWTAVAWPPF